MFDPLFSLLVLAIVMVPTAVIIFLFAVRRRPVGYAVLLAVVVSAATLIGFFGSAAIQIRTNLLFLEEPPLLRLVISLTVAALFGWAATYLTLRGTKG